MALTPIKICSKALLFLSLLVLGTSATAVTNIQLTSVSDLLIQSALDSLNANSPTHHTYKSGNLISAQKLLEAPYVIYRLTLNLEANCNDDTTCPREACAIDLRQHEEGVIDVEKSSIQCMYLHPQSSQDEIQQHVQETISERTEGAQREAASTESVLQLDHEVETVLKNGSERPFIAVRATDRNYCAGCPYELNPTLPGLAAFGEQVVQKMDDSGRSDFKHKVVSIVRVTRAVPPGSNVVKYELNLEIGETNCPKSTLIQRSECTLLPNIPIKLCRVTFEERPWQENSRKITANNCTDVPDSDNELNGSYERPLTVSESLTTSSSAWRAQESPILASSIHDFSDRTTAAPITEDTIQKVVLSTENTEEQRTTGFIDKIKEFDAFLEDFDIPIRNRTSEPENHGLPVNEELIRPEVVQRTRAPILQRDEGDSSPTVLQESSVRTRRSLVETPKAEKGFVRKLAQKAINVLDDIDVDNNKRIVLDVLDSRKEDIHDGTVYHVTMKVAPTNCDEARLKSIAECLKDVREPTKICKVQIHTDKKASLASAKVLQMQCHPEENNGEAIRVRRQIPGGATQKNIDDPEIRAYAEKGVNKFSQISDSENEPFLVEILEATAQVVSGMLYKIKVRLGESTCRKGVKENCQLKEQSDVNDYLITVWSQPWVDKGNPDIKVEPHSNNNQVQRVRRSVGLLGGVTQKDPNDPEIREYVNQGLQKFSENSVSANEPFLVQVLEATSQVVSGMLYKIKVRVGESTCPKGSKENCQLKQESGVDDYLITVASQPWIDHGNPDIKIERKRGERHRRQASTNVGQTTQLSPNDPGIQASVKIVSEENNGETIRVRRQQMPGGATQKNIDDPEIRAYAEKGVNKFSQISDSENEPFLVEILEATAQVVSGMLYKIKVRLGESTCRKGVKENCQLKEQSDVNDYLITVWSQPWVDKGNPDIKVEPHSNNNQVQRVRRSVGLLGGVTQKDPNDPEIREYVNQGLQKFSENSVSANEPFLVQVLEATSQVVSGMLYKIKVRVGESTCPKGSKENCQLKQESGVDDYLITVASQPWIDHGNPDIKIERKREERHRRQASTNVGQTTQLSPNDPGIQASVKIVSEENNGETIRVRRQQMPGGATQKNIDDPEIRAYAEKGVNKFSQISDSENEPFLVEILEATAQVVSGMLYKIKVRLGESTCRKGVKENCLLKEQSDVNDYLITVWSQPWVDKGNPDIKVESQSNNNQVQRVRRSVRRLGGVTQKDPNDPEIREYVDKGLRKFSENSVSANEPFLVQVLEATSQVVSGMLYKIKVRLGESTCPKGSKENCQLKQESGVDDYLITVWSQPWVDHGNPDIKIERKREERHRRQASTNVGQTMQLSPNDPEIQAYANRGVGAFSSSFEGPYEHLLTEITEASVQIVSGKLYTIKTRLGESDCPKGSKQGCQLKPNGEIKDCTMTVWSQPWLDKGNPEVKVKCTSSSPQTRKKRSLRGANYNSKMLNLAQDIKHEKNFQQFMSKYEKVYASEEEKKARFEIFKANMKLAEKLSENEQGTAVYGASIFADIAPEEFRAKYLGLKPELRSDNQIPFPQAQIPDFKLPEEFDWRHYNVVTEVKNQQACGSCWAFAVTGNIEGLYAIKTGRLLSLSEQELVDCDTLDQGCEGGLPDNAYRAIETLGGLELENDYPYDGRDEKCHFDKSKARVNVISGLNITSNETGMAQWLVKNGPISIGINANAMQLYMGGVSHPFSFLCSPKNLDHGVLIVGYGVHTYPIFKKRMPYWIIKNSWGPSWGEQGYYRVYRGDGTCGLNTMASSAILK